jgi:hypothetical protein
VARGAQLVRDGVQQVRRHAVTALGVGVVAASTTRHAV